MQGDAIFDTTRRYRYSLWRCWQVEAPRLAVVMLNPSTADAQTNDATIRRCLSFAQAWGYGSLEVVNLFALMSTRPQQLKRAAHPIGVDCDRYLRLAAAQADQIVIAWGNWGTWQHRDRTVLQLLRTHSRPEQIYCLGVNRDGQPCHPLYLPRTTRPVPFRCSID
jgi:hypothetical protein